MSTMDDKTRSGPAFSARPEAMPRQSEELTDQQRAALGRALEFIRQYAQHSAPRDDARSLPKFLPQLERRFNQVLMIDGGRGSGKTTVLLTLMKKLIEEAYPPAGTAGPLPPSNVIPLRIIRLDGLPADRSVAYQLISTLEGVVDAIDQAAGAAGEQPPPTVLPAPWTKAETKSRRAWRSLSAALALAWTPDHGRRDLSASARIIDFEDVERRLGHTTDLFEALVGALVAEFRANGAANPLFIIPIDDADMSPEKTLELLEMLRVFVHRRAVFLLTGDTELLNASARNACLGVLRSSLASQPTPASLAFSQDEPLAASLAAALVEKVVPKPQRLRLEPLTENEVTTIVDDYDRAALSNMSASPSASGRPPRKEGFDLLCHALPRRLRTLIDVLHQLDAFGPVRGLDAKTANELWHGQLESARDHLAAPIHRGLREGMVVVGDALRIFPERVPIARRSVAYSRLRGDPGIQILTDHVLGTEIRGVAARDDQDGHSVRVDQASPEFDGLHAAAVFAWAVATEGEADSRLSDAVRRLDMDEVLLVEANVATGDAVHGLISWPRPASSLLRLTDLLRRWTHVLQVPSAETTDTLIVKFLSVIGPCALDAANPNFEEWLREAVSKKDPAFLDWAQRGLPLLIAPESRLPRATADLLFAAWQSVVSDVGPELVLELRVQRLKGRRLLRQPAPMGSERDWLRQLDDQNDCALVRWLGKQEPPSPQQVPPPGGVQAFLNHLGAYAIETRRRYANLQHYFTARRQEALGADWATTQRMLDLLTRRSPVPGATSKMLVDIAATTPKSRPQGVEVDGVHVRINAGLYRRAVVAGDVILDFSTSGLDVKLCDVVVGEPGTRDLSPAAQAVLDVAIDLQADAEYQTNPSTESPVSCAAFPGLLAFGRGVPMPVFPALIDLETLADQSNAAVRALASNLGDAPGQRSAREQVVDAYLLGLMSCIAGMESQARPSVPVSLGTELRASPAWITHLFAERSGSSAGYRRLVARWIEEFPLVASPEWGASWAFCDMLLNAVALSKAAAERLLLTRSELLGDKVALEKDHPWARLVVAKASGTPTEHGES